VTRRVLIISGRFGKGHDTVAEATAAALEPLDVECRIVDAIALLGGRASTVGDRVFRTLLRITPLYDALHFSQLRTGGRLARLLDRAALRTMYPHFVEETNAFPPDLIVSVFATGAAAAARYKSEHPNVVAAVFITDSYAHRLWVHEATDVFLVTSTLGARSVQGLRPRARVAVVTAPTRPEFYSAPPKHVARAALGVPDDARCALMMSGAWGLGPVAECARELARCGIWVLAVAGSNESLQRTLQGYAAVEKRIIPFGFTRRIPELMAASDVVISSSGDTCREARVVGRGLILIDVVPGHGRENLMHELEIGGAAVSTTDPHSLVEAVEVFLSDPMHAAIEPVNDPNAWERELRATLAAVGFG
jgi:processive 1,2-diacylglycerol beta-glucosyltransferase